MEIELKKFCEITKGYINRQNKLSQVDLREMLNFQLTYISHSIKKSLDELQKKISKSYIECKTEDDSIRKSLDELQKKISKSHIGCKTKDEMNGFIPCVDCEFLDDDAACGKERKRINAALVKED